MASKKKAAPKKATRKKAAARKGAKRSARESSLADRVAALAAAFQALGARDPHRWARAQAKGGADELARFVLLRALWLKVLEPGRMLARAQQDPHVGRAMTQMLRKVDLADLDAIVRITQEHALKDALSVLDHPADDEQGISWAVYRRDRHGAPAARLAHLIEDLEAAKP